MIRSSKHSIKFAKRGKIERLDDFLSEYQRIGQIILDSIWENGYLDFKIETDSLSFPKYINYKDFILDTDLSARALSSLVTQLSGIIRAATEKRRSLLWVAAKIEEEGGDSAKLRAKLAKSSVVKPTFPKIAELSSKCCILNENTEHFDGFICLKSIGGKFGVIRIPIKFTESSNKWKESGKTLGSFLVSAECIQLRFEIGNKLKKDGVVVGIDQGMKTVATLSSGVTTPEKDIHGNSLESICEKMARKRKGSKAFLRLQKQRKNFINWTLNQIDWSGIKEIRLEKIWNIGFKKSRSRKMSHWTNTLIRDKIKRLAEESEVLVIEQDSTYRSQRCSCCGIVRKANRKGKVYSCKHCSNIMDADLNASLNHSIDLPKINWTLRGQKYNLGNGFYWRPCGLYNFDGSELKVPDSEQKNIFL